MEEILNSYYMDNARKLRNIIDKIFCRKYGGTANKDMEEFYSVGNDVFTDIIKNKRYDKSKGNFDGFIYGALDLAIIDEFKRQNRDKRTAKIEIEEKNEKGEVKKMQISVPDIYMDTPIGDDSTIGDMIPSDFDIDDALTTDIVENCSSGVKEYYDNLSDTQKNIAELIMQGYKKNFIIQCLNLTEKEYQDNFNIMGSYDKKRILFKDNDMEDEKMNTVITMEDVAERYKNTSYSIDSISKQLRKKRIRDDHILQRHSGQWKGFAKSELISDILRGKSLTQIIISEEIKNNVRMQWLIDGKQRCTTLDDYLHNGFSISKNVKNYNIKYQTAKLDEEGNEVLNEEGFPITEVKEFDIRGKKFSQLPEELQDVFKDRQIPVLYNTNCTKKDIADDIARFNRSRPMNTAQNGWLGLDESFAEFVENIVKMPFFQIDFKGSSYTKCNHTSGNMRRIVVESIMTSDFIEDFGDFDKMCEFLTEEASDSNFTEFYSLVERLTLVANDEVADMFNLKDSFLWFGLFSKFSAIGMQDKYFIDFMNEFKNSLISKKVNGVSFEELCINPKTGKSMGTKDKNIVIKKLDLLETLLYEFLHINKEDIEKIEDIETFISKVAEIDKSEVHKNIEIYNQDLNGKGSLIGLKDNCIRDGSRLLESQNNLSLLAMVAYSYKIGQDLDKWLTEYSSKNNTYIADQRKNFYYMKNSFNEYLKKGKVA